MYKRILQRCNECGKEEVKYKCPTCRAPYCSAACCKDHQAFHKKSSDITTDFVVDTTPNSNANIENLCEDDRLALDGISPTNKLSKEDLSKLDNSDKLKQLLSNPHLRDYLSYINSLEYPRGFMKIAMQEPIFVEFADACLNAIHPEEHKTKELTDEEIVGKLQEKLLEKTEEDMV